MLKKEVKMKLRYFSSNWVIVILFFLLFLCFTSNIIAEEHKETSDNSNIEITRVRDFFDIGEKSFGPGTARGIRKINNYDKVNAFSILDVKLRKNGIEKVKKLGYYIVLIADIKKKGEETWSRISIINKFAREVKKTPEPNIYEPQFFYVAESILLKKPIIKEGEDIHPLFESILNEIEKKPQSILTIPAQEMFIVTVGSGPQRYAAKDGDEIRLRFLRAEYPKNASNKYADLISIEDELHFIFKKFGYKLNIIPAIVFGSRVGDKFDWENFDPIDQNLSFGSNIYITYEGRNPNKKIVNFIPGIHLSLLGLIDSDEAEFTFGFVTPFLPALREYFGFFYGWHDLKNPVIGLTFSLNIDFKALVSAEREK